MVFIFQEKRLKQIDQRKGASLPEDPNYYRRREMLIRSIGITIAAVVPLFPYLLRNNVAAWAVICITVFLISFKAQELFRTGKKVLAATLVGVLVIGALCGISLAEIERIKVATSRAQVSDAIRDLIALDPKGLTPRTFQLEIPDDLTQAQKLGLDSYFLETLLKLPKGTYTVTLYEERGEKKFWVAGPGIRPVLFGIAVDEPVISLRRQ